MRLILQPYLKHVSITKYKSLSRNVFRILYSITLPTKAETQHTFWKATEIQITFNCHEMACQMSNTKCILKVSKLQNTNYTQSILNKYFTEQAGDKRKKYRSFVEVVPHF